MKLLRRIGAATPDRETNVHKDNIRPLLRRLIDCLSRRSGRSANHAAELGDHRRKVHCDDRLVLDDENPHWSVRRWQWHSEFNRITRRLAFHVQFGVKLLRKRFDDAAA